jgi:hypothetical protein
VVARTCKRVRPERRKRFDDVEIETRASSRGTRNTGEAESTLTSAEIEI